MGTRSHRIMLGGVTIDMRTDVCVRGYDRLAKVYWFLEWALFRGDLQRARTCLLEMLPECKRMLILGDGDGRYLREFVRAQGAANVISVDISQEQLNKDLLVAEREGLKLLTIKADISDLSDFKNSTFDLVINAASTVFVPEVEKVWSEFYRVLKPGGELFAGMLNPSFFLFDHADAIDRGVLEVKHRLPYSDVESLDEKELNRIVGDEVPLVWSHTLETLIGGQTKAGFVIMDFYED